MTSLTANADRLVTENFEYPDGTQLYQQGAWLQYSTNAADPVTVSTPGLTYSGYLNDAVGAKVTLGQTASGQDLMIPVTDEKGIDAGPVYYSFLINVKDLGEKDSKAYFMCLVPNTKNGLNDKGSGSEYVKLYALPSGAEGKFNFAFHSSAAYDKASVNKSGDCDLNTTYLIVMRWEKAADSGSKDAIKMWVNPVIGAQEPVATVTRSSEDTGSNLTVTNGGLKYIEFRQGATASNSAPLVEIDGLRVADTWADLFDLSSQPADKPAIFTSVVEKELPVMLVGESYSFTANISGENLEDDITFTLSSEIKASPASVAKEDAMAEGGVDVTFTITPTAANDNYSRIITLTSGEAQSVEIRATGTVIAPVKTPTSVAAKAQVDNMYEFMQYTGKAVITAIEEESAGRVVYLQDMFGAMKLDSQWLQLSEYDFKVGDEISGFLFMFTEDASEKLPVMTPLVLNEEDPLFTVTQEGKFKTPTEIRVADVTATTAADYLWKLVTVKDATFTSENQATFANAKNFYFTDADGTRGTLRVFSTSGLAGKDVPTGTVSLTGISNSAAQLSLFLRGEDDIVAGEPSLNVTQERLFDFTTNAAPVGEATPVMAYTVVAENLPQALPIEFGGADAAYFSANIDAVPAGSGTHVITVTYNPAAIGRHSASFSINADGVNPEFNFTRSLSAKAYDPRNLPVITIDPAELVFETIPNKPVKKTVTLNAENCFDYIQGQLSNTSGSAFTIDNTYLLPDSKNVILTITFNPSEEGEYAAVATYKTTLGKENAILNLRGVCEGEVIPEDPQGDPFVVNSANPFVTYSQDFDSASHNEPLKLEGWTNVAAKGTRAWWGYESFEDNDRFTAAKITAYDSKLSYEKGHDVEMLLISPALNFKDAGDRHLTFRLRGDYLSEGQESTLDIMLGIPNDTEQPDFYVMDGFGIPATADESGEWIPYDVDMSVVEDMPDTFHIAFRLQSHRSKEQPATYYIDDFKWNPSGTVLAVDSIIDGSELYDVYNLQGMQLLKGADAPTLKTLPAGLYIVNGRKVILK